MSFISCMTLLTEANIAIVPKPVHLAMLQTWAKQSSATALLWMGHAFPLPARH